VLLCTFTLMRHIRAVRGRLPPASLSHGRSQRLYLLFLKSQLFWGSGPRQDNTSSMGHQEGVLFPNRLGDQAFVIGNEGINLIGIYTKIHLYYIDYTGCQKHLQLLSTSVFPACGSFFRKGFIVAGLEGRRNEPWSCSALFTKPLT